MSQMVHVYNLTNFFLCHVITVPLGSIGTQAHYTVEKKGQLMVQINYNMKCCIVYSTYIYIAQSYSCTKKLRELSWYVNKINKIKKKNKNKINVLLQIPVYMYST